MKRLIMSITIAAALVACSNREQPGRYQMAIIPATPINDEQLIILDTATGEGKLFMGKQVQGFSYTREEITKMRDVKRAE